MANASFLAGTVAARWAKVGAVEGTIESAGAEELRAGCWNIELGLSEGGGVSGRSFVLVLKLELMGEEVSNLKGGIVGATAVADEWEPCR